MSDDQARFVQEIKRNIRNIHYKISYIGNQPLSVRGVLNY